MCGTYQSALRALALGGASVAALASPAWAQDRVVEFRLPAQDMAVALETFARQSQADIMFDRRQVQGLTSRPVQGRFTAEQALRALIGGTSLQLRRVNATTFSIEPVKGSSQDVAAMPAMVEDVIVTGSHIRGAAPTAPVHLVTREDIDASGYGQIGDVIRSLPENYAGGQNPGVIGLSSLYGNNVNATNASSVNLRGLGTDATLVLVNGRRLSPDAFYGGTDISGIPLAAVQRVEIVTDGSSAVYGSDAIAGVANFILRKNYDGAEVSSRLGGTSQGGGFEQTYSGLIGIARDRWYAMLSAEYLEQDPIKASDRAFTSEAAPDTSLVRQMSRASLFGSVGVDLAPSVSVSLDVLLSDRDVFDVSRTRSTAIQYQNEAQSPSYSVSSEAEFVLPADWTLRVMAVAAGSRNSLWARWLPNSASHNRYNNDVNYYEGIAEGRLFSLPSGDVDVAIGGGWRRENFTRSSATAVSGAIDASREIGYVFGEAIVPLVSPSDTRTGLNALDLSVSARLEDYSDFGTTSTPKVGLRYMPVPGLTIRSTWGESFKAPAFVSLYTSQTLALYPSTSFGYSDGGTAFLWTGGNADLDPETSESWTIGADYSPRAIPSLGLSATYFNINYTDRIITPVRPATIALSDPAFAPWITWFPTAQQQQDALSNARFSNSSGGPYDPSTVVAIIDSRFSNATAQTVEGIDLSYRQSFEINGGYLRAFANATWTNLSQQVIPTRPETGLSGTLANVPDFRARAGASWERDLLSASLIANYISPEVDTGITPNRDIAGWTTVDATVGYEVGGLQATLAVSNLFDMDPPYAASPSLAYEGIYFDSANYSAIGRLVSLTLRKRF